MKRIVAFSIFLLLTFALFSQEINTDFESQKKRIIKMEFFSPLTGHTTFGYEKYVKDWFSWEAKIGIIGLGIDNDLNSRGLLFRGGPKFKLNPDFVTDDLRGSHLLSGKYIRPELVVSVYNEEAYDYNYSSGVESQSRQNFTSVAFLINYGRQYILADIMSLDWHIGIGYGFDNTDEGGYRHSHTNGDSDFPVALSAGFTIGILLK